MKRAELAATLEAAFPGAPVEIEDLTGTEDHYQVRIVSEAFEGLSRLARQRAVHAVLGEAVGSSIHALALETHTPAEWQRRGRR